MRAFIAIAFVFISFFSSAQSATLVVEGTTPNLYITHTVSPKESFYSVARLYNVGPGVIADFNKSNLQTGLQIGQTIKVPLVAQNFDQAGKKEAGETLVPVYHVVAKSETLFRIGANNNKVAVASIKQWNGLASDNVVAGTPLVVGHLKIKNEQLNQLNAAIPTATTTPQIAQQQNSFNPTAGSNIKASENVEAAITLDEKQTKIEEPEAEKVKEPEITKVIEPKTETPVTKTNTENKPDLLAPVISATPEEGFFAATFTTDIDDKNLAENNGEAGTFKSTSGWQNKKYYALMNDVEPGTVVKISTGEKVVYAKVLGSLPDMKEDRLLLLRLSNSAASYLGKIDPKFPVQVSYYK